MRWIKKGFDFYIESSIHVALSVFALVHITFLESGIPIDEAVANFAFFGTIVGYNFIKYDELVRVRKVQLTSLFKAIVLVSFLSFLAAFYFFLQLQMQTKLCGFVALLLTIIYTLPFIPKKTNMRNWAGVKIYLVTIAWVVVTVWLPLVDTHFDWSISLVVISLQRFVLVFVLMLVFEIVDLQNDELKLQTIPQKIGVRRTKFLAYFLIFVFLFLETIKSEIATNRFNIALLVSSLLVLFTFFVSDKKSKYYTSFWVEAVPVFWWILLLIF